MAWCDVILLGCGLGTDQESEKKAAWFIQKARENQKPLILDADGLNLLSHNPCWYELLPEHTIMTPHMGEFSRLTGKSIQELKENFIQEAQRFARAHAVTLILKDARTVIACPDGTTYLNITGNSGMATAGSGDVLSGILAGLITSLHKQEWKEVRAAAGVDLHGRAGDAAAAIYGKRSMTAGHIIEGLQKVIRQIEEKKNDE